MTWINHNWARIGGCGALLIIAWFIREGMPWHDLNALLWIHLALLLLHQFEEYVYPGGFKDFFNRHIHGKNPVLRFPLTDPGILLVNVLLAWAAFLCSALAGPALGWLAVGLLGVTLL
ncbi:MAG: HXXEE domain-containing protein, partial [Lewinella sp.]|nr:HXXEE domain-containing protein [Lewinella sp.]